MILALFFTELPSVVLYFEAEFLPVKLSCSLPHLYALVQVFQLIHTNIGEMNLCPGVHANTQTVSLLNSFITNCVLSECDYSQVNSHLLRDKIRDKHVENAEYFSARLVLSFLAYLCILCEYKWIPFRFFVLQQKKSQPRQRIYYVYGNVIQYDIACKRFS